MVLELRQFHADSTDPDDAAAVDASFALLEACRVVDSPWEHPWLRDPYKVFLERGWDGEPPVTFLAWVDGVPVAKAFMFLSERDNTHLAWVWVAVHPDERRQGFGSALLRYVEERAREAGRTTIGTDGWESGRTSGFASAHGLAPASQGILRRQHLDELDLDHVRTLRDAAAALASDYELVRIEGRTPPEMVDAMVELVAAINDAPTDDLDIEDEVFTPERLASYEQTTMAKGNRLYRLVARHRDTGDLAGHTVVAVDGERPVWAEQHDTSVVAAHRGHRLGLALKLEMLRWLVEAEPQVREIDTWNAESNGHMVGVNKALGYHVLGRVLDYQRSV